MAACRAVICAALWPDPVDPSFPLRFRQLLSKDFVDATLHCPKSALKQAAVAEKSQIWLDLYSRECVKLSAPVKDRLVIIVDDLYQSGVTMWAYAKFLKSQGAAHVLGLPCVKSLRDSDNT